MIDSSTNKPLKVSSGGKASFYLRIPYSQVEKVRPHFDSHGINYWVSENVISFDGGPEIALIGLSHVTDPTTIQSILDGIP